MSIGAGGVPMRQAGAATVRTGKGLLGRLEPYLWVLPAVTIYAVFVAYPVYFAFNLGLVDWSGMTPIEQMKWVGLKNFIALLQDDVFLLALRNSVVYAIVSTIVTCALAFTLALALWYRAPRGAGFLRSFIFYPSILSNVILALAWFQIYGLYGLLNNVLTTIVGQPVQILWLTNVDLAFWSVMSTDIWKSTGFTMMLFLASMSAISEDVMDSARVEGASSFQIARHIVEPMTRYATGLVVLLNIIGGLQVFGPIWVMTRGGPVHSTEVLSTYSFWLAFVKGSVGYSGAVASVGVLILFALAVARVQSGKLIIGESS